MNYDLARQGYGQIDYSIKQGLRSGDMPSTMLMEKFEETDMNDNDDEIAYDSFVRTEICNWGPDKGGLLEHEGRRGGVNASKGILQLRATGHRGSADVEKPEIFLGFAGPEDRDPRGINVDPDMKQLRRQEASRMRFHRFTPDHSDDVTGGGISEAQVMSNKQSIFRFNRDRLKIFSRQIDGRREGMRRVYENKSDIAKQVLVQSYGDMIKDYAMNPQRRANLITKNILRDTKEWRQETSDQDYQIARYSQICRKRKTRDTYNRVLGAKASDDTKWSDADTTKCFKAMGLLMSHMVRGKKIKQQCGDGDIDMEVSRATQDRKNTPVARDLALILRSMVTDAKTFSTSDNTMLAKSLMPVRNPHLATQVVYNHIAPAHHYLNAEILYKSVRPGADMSKIKSEVITDSTAPNIRDTVTIGGKTAKLGLMRVATRNQHEDADRSDGEVTVNYRQKLFGKGKARQDLTSGEDFKKESDDTQSRKEGHTNHRVVNPNDHVTGIAFNDNAVKERLGGHHGSKYTQRLIDRDGRGDSVSDGN